MRAVTDQSYKNEKGNTQKVGVTEEDARVEMKQLKEEAEAERMIRMLCSNSAEVLICAERASSDCYATVLCNYY